MYEIPSDEYVRKCVITKEVVADHAEPVLTYGDEPRAMKNNLKKRIKRNEDSIA